MKATLIGHATWLLETAGGNLITDPVFFDPQRGQSAAEMPLDEKNRISHRALAAAQMADLMREAWGL